MVIDPDIKRMVLYHQARTDRGTFCKRLHDESNNTSHVFKRGVVSNLCIATELQWQEIERDSAINQLTNAPLIHRLHEAQHCETPGIPHVLNRCAIWRMRTILREENRIDATRQMVSDIMPSAKPERRVKGLSVTVFRQTLSDLSEPVRIARQQGMRVHSVALQRYPIRTKVTFFKYVGTDSISLGRINCRAMYGATVSEQYLIGDFKLVTLPRDELG